MDTGVSEEMIDYTDGTVALDKWDLRALFELWLNHKEKPRITDKDVEDKRNEMTKTLLRRTYFRLKYPWICLER